MSHYAKSQNTNPLAPYIIYEQETDNGRVFRIRGPGCTEVYPWGSYAAAEQEVYRLLGKTKAAA